ncbi:MAG: hypothetical protein ACKV2V_25875 [Blastocatellia bacterium]
MKKISRYYLLFAAGVLLTLQITGCHAGRSRAEARHGKAVKGDDTADLPIRENIDQKYELATNARVSVWGINGKVDIETGEGPNTEIHIVRSARNQETLDRRRTVIEFTPQRLVIRGEKREGGSLWDFLKGNDEMRMQVRLVLPRAIGLEVSGVNGHVTVGEITGELEISGVNGHVSTQANADKASFSGINGEVGLTVRDPHRTVDISGVNGPIDVRIAGNVNADIEVSGLNGRFHNEGLNIEMPEKKNRRNFSAKLGAGGAAINISGVNGAVTFQKAGAVIIPRQNSKEDQATGK